MSEIAVVLKNEDLVSRFAVVAPNWMAYEAEYGFAIQQLKANSFTMKIATQNPDTLMQAMSNVAACGLSLNPAKKEAYLVPRKGKICLDPAYGGLVKLATDTGSILWVQARLVHENDSFVMRDIDQVPDHSFDPFSDRGPVTGVYCTAKVHDGSFLTEAMNRHMVEEIRDRSEAYKANPEKTPWFTDPGEMFKKTVIRRASKLWPKSDNIDAEMRLAAAIQVSNDNEEIKLVTSSPPIGDYSDEQKAYFDQLISDSKDLDMYVLSQTTDTGIMTSLYNSFEKGSITKYKRIVDEMIRKGMDLFNEYVNAAGEASQIGDDLALTQMKDEVSEDTWNLVLTRI